MDINLRVDKRTGSGPKPVIPPTRQQSHQQPTICVFEHYPKLLQHRTSLSIWTTKWPVSIQIQEQDKRGRQNELPKRRKVTTEFSR
jgi:hypothetical protein